jgi:O-antigen/teichoic acid export membrane protein
LVQGPLGHTHVVLTFRVKNIPRNEVSLYRIRKTIAFAKALATSQVFLALYGFPSAISKMVVDRKSQYQELSLFSFYLPVLFILFLISGGLFVFLFVNAPYIAGWIGDSLLIETYRFTAFAFLLIPVIALLRGVFQGNYMMKPTAFSQLAEQTIRVAVIIATAIVIAEKRKIHL